MKKKKSYRIKKRDNYVKESRDEKVKSIAPFTSFIRDSSSEEARFKRIGIIYGILFGILMFIGTYFLKESLVFSFSFSLIFIIVYFAFFYFKRIFKLASKVEKMESSFPDFLQLVAGNLRAGSIALSTVIPALKFPATNCKKSGKELSIFSTLEANLKILLK